VTKSRSRVWKGVVRELEIRVFVPSCTGTVPEALLVSEDEKLLGVFFFFCLESPLLVSYFGLAKAVKYDCLAAMKGTPPIRSTYRSTLGSPCLLLIIQPLRPLWKQPLDN